MMIELTRIAVVGDLTLDLCFSDKREARWSAAQIVARDTPLTRPLLDPAFFARAFIEGGALAWPNGLELSPSALHAQLITGEVADRPAA